MEPHDIIDDPFQEMREAARTSDSKKKEEARDLYEAFGNQEHPS